MSRIDELKMNALSVRLGKIYQTLQEYSDPCKIGGIDLTRENILILAKEGKEIEERLDKGVSE